MNKEDVYIIIPVHNRKEITLKCLDALQQNGDLDKYCIVVVDDGSTDSTSEAIKSLYPDVIILTGDGNLWWTGAIAMGMKYAYERDAEYFIWLNNDCLVSSNVFDTLVVFCQNNPSSIIGSQGREIQNPKNISFGGKNKYGISYRIINCPHDQIIQCDLLSGNLVCISRSVVKKIGYPEHKLVPHYGGDSHYLIKARLSGFKIFIDNHHLIFNLCGESEMSPQRWLLKKGKPLDIMNLLFNRYSLYSWRVWLTLNQTEYGKLIGTFIFIFHYMTHFVIPIFVISLLRFLPFSTRNYLSRFKQKIMNCKKNL